MNCTAPYRAVTRARYHAARRSYRAGQRFAAMSDSYAMRSSDERAASSYLAGLPSELVRIITHCQPFPAPSWTARRRHLQQLVAWRHTPEGSTAYTEQQIAHALADARQAYRRRSEVRHG